MSTTEAKQRYDHAYRLGGPTPTQREMVAGAYVEALEAEVERLSADLATARAERDGLTKALASGIDDMCEGWCSDGGRGQFEDCFGCWLAARTKLAALRTTPEQEGKPDPNAIHDYDEYPWTGDDVHDYD